MGQWGWRPLLFAVFMSVWVTSCSISGDAAPTLLPTNTPQITLTTRPREPLSRPTDTTATLTPTSAATRIADAMPTIYVVRPGDTLLGIALDFGVDVTYLRAANGDLDPRTLQVGQQIIIPPPGSATVEAPPRLQLEPPNCYPALNGGTRCIGRITNLADYPVEQVRVRVQLFQPPGTALAERSAGPEQAIIPPGAAAPYSATFNTRWQPDIQAQIILEHAMAAVRVDARFITLSISDEQVLNGAGRYRVQAALTNPGDHAAGVVRLTLILLDPAGHTTGYRVQRVAEALPAGGSLQVQIEAVPQGDVADHQLYVEARRAP